MDDAHSKWERNTVIVIGRILLLLGSGLCGATRCGDDLLIVSVSGLVFDGIHGR